MSVWCHAQREGANIAWLTDWLFLFSEKSSEAAAAEAEGVTGEGAAAWEGAGERTAAYRQTCKKDIGAPIMSAVLMEHTDGFFMF